VEEAVPPPGPLEVNLNKVQRIVTTELDEYKATLRIDMGEIFQDGEKGWFINPLACWKGHKETFSILSQIARKLLCIPATSAPSERVFSVAGLPISKLRSRLDSENASWDLRDNWDLIYEMNGPAEVVS
jgi:hAT family C-terminal dimerisation region